MTDHDDTRPLGADDAAPGAADQGAQRPQPESATVVMPPAQPTVPITPPVAAPAQPPAEPTEPITPPAPPGAATPQPSASAPPAPAVATPSQAPTSPPPPPVAATPPPPASAYPPPPPGFGTTPGFAPPAGGYPAGYVQGTWPAPTNAENGMGTAALVLGILGLVGLCAWGFGIIASILAIIFGKIGMNKASQGRATNGGSAKAGLVMGIIGVSLFVVGFVLMLLLLMVDASAGMLDT